MNKKNLIKFILKILPFIIGTILYSFEIVNLVSTLLLFVGGYVVIKNLLDYRLFARNIMSIFENKQIEIDKEKEIGKNNLERGCERVVELGLHDESLVIDERIQYEIDDDMGLSNEDKNLDIKIKVKRKKDR